MGKALLSTTGLGIVAILALLPAVATAQAQTPVTGQSDGEQTAAADASSRHPSSFSDIIVTARRVEERLQDVPVAVSALGGADLDKLNVAAAADIQSRVPNLYIRQDSLGGASQPSFLLRGQIQTLSTEENVATYFADVPQSTHGIASALYDIQSIQVLNGPQGTLFGRNSNGGAVVITPNRPTAKLEGWGKVTFGSYDLHQFTGVFNLPIAEGIKLRLAGDIARQDGTVKNLKPGYADLDNQRHESFRASLLLEPSSTLSNLMVFDYTHRNEIPTPFIVNEAAGPVFGSFISQVLVAQQAVGPFKTFAYTGENTTTPEGRSVTNSIKDRIYGLSNVTNLTLSDSVSVKNILGYRHQRDLAYLDLGGLGGVPTNGLLFGFIPVTNASLGINNTQQILRRRQFTEELQIIGNSLEGRLQWIVGGFYSNTRDRWQVDSELFVGPIPIFSFSQGPEFRYFTYRQKTKAAFAQATLDLSDWTVDGLSVTAGVRRSNEQRSILLQDFEGGVAIGTQWDPARSDLVGGDLHCRLHVPGQPATPFPGADLTTCLTRDRNSFNATTYNLSANYKPSDNVLIYLAHRKGFKSGGINYTVDNPDFNDFGGETLTDFEIGLKASGRVADMPFRFSVAAYRGKFKGIQTQSLPDLSPPGFPQTQIILFISNNPNATLKGFELSASLKPAPDLEISGNYAYNDGRYTSGAVAIDQASVENPALGVPIAGKSFPGTPKQTFSTNATYTLGFLPRSAGEVSVTGSYAWKSRAPGLVATGTAAVPAYGVFDASATWESMLGTSIDLSLFVRNLTDKAYRTTCLDNLATLGYRSCVYGRQRTFGMSLTARFGD